MKPKYAASSIKTMDLQIKRMMLLMDSEIYDIKKLSNIDEVKRIISTEIDKTACQKAVLNTVIKVLEYEEIELGDLPVFFKSIAKQHNAEYQYKEPSETELQNMITVDELYVLFKQYRKNLDYTDLQRHLKYVILAMYSLYPPLRGQEWFETKTCNIKNNEEFFALLRDGKHNLYNRHDGTLYIRYYKTSSAYGDRVLILPKSLTKIINKWISYNPSLYLVPNLHTGTPLSSQGFTSKLHQIFTPKDVSTSLLRKIYISYIVPTLSNPERKELAHIMGHSLVMQEFVYNKFI